MSQSAVVIIICSLTMACSGCSCKQSDKNTTSGEVAVQEGSAKYQECMELLKLFDKWMDSYITVIKNYETNPLYYMGKYFSTLKELAEWEEKFSNINEEDMTEYEVMKVLEEYYRIMAKQVQAVENR